MPGAKVMQPGGGSSSFAAGDAVVLQGLGKKPELNGKEGKVTGAEKDGRFPVKLTDGTSISVKAANLMKKPNPAADAAAAAAREQMNRLPIMYDYKGNLKWASDASKSVSDRVACFKTLLGHAQSQEAEHHKKLLAADFHTIILEVVANPDTSPIVEISDGNGSDNSTASAASTTQGVTQDAKEAEALQLIALGVIATFCGWPDNVAAVLEAGVLTTVTPLLLRGGDLRSGSVDVIGTLSNHPDGKVALAKSSACMRALNKICVEEDDAQIAEGCMSALGQLLYHQDCWKPLEDAGIVRTATAMLRKSSTSPGGAARAAGMLNLWVILGKVGSVKDEPGCMEALHAAARNRFGPEAAATATKTIQAVMEKAQKVAAGARQGAGDDD